VLDLLGPPYRPMKQATTGEVPRWFVAHISPDGMLRQKNIIDDPTRARR